MSMSMPQDLHAPILDATWPAATLSALREVAGGVLGWQIRVLAARPWLPDAPWSVVCPFAYGGRSLLAGIFVEDADADTLCRHLSVLNHPADEHDIGLALGELADELSRALVERRRHVAADMSAGPPIVCRGRMDVGTPALSSALEVQMGPIKAWLALIRPPPPLHGIPGPLLG